MRGMLDYLWNVPRDIWIFNVSSETNFFAENIGEFQTIGIALITLLIPLGLSLLQSENKDFPTLDKKAIRTHAVNPPRIVIAILWLVITPLLWGASSYLLIDIFILLLLLGGIIFILSVMKNMWEWTSFSGSLRRKKRVEFLNDLAIKDDWEMKLTVWEEILKKENLERHEINYFIEPLLKTIRYLNEHQKTGEWNSFLQLFFENYQRIYNLVIQDGVISTTDDRLMRCGIELLMREFVTDEDLDWFAVVIIDGERKSSVKYLLEQIETLQDRNLDHEIRDYNDFISGKVTDYYDSEKIVYELPEGKKAAWKKLFE